MPSPLLIISCIFTLALVGLALHRTHLISALLSLEGMMLSLYAALTLWSLQMDMAAYGATPLLMMTFSACEASSGLALLIATARTHGTDQLMTMNFLQC
uniref:NADH dehydrogenase subunit 4L n=1 Tax=Bregmaceros mcclellandi TaxID=2831535 RepID=UPI001EDF1B62|nr:NADH dehydrogenase subunit 4L [Bregmaceros mcclellandi]UIX24722.1 NADH dehydrogenase subunit 4L [Bregmaceros mcclellandi]